MLRPASVLLTLLLSSAVQAPDDDALSKRLNQLAAPRPAVTGVAIVHVESGASAALNPDDWFPMMSVYKLPIVVHALRQADAGALDLSTKMTLTAAARRPGRSALSERIAAQGPQTLTVRELIESVVRESDNADLPAGTPVARRPGTSGTTEGIAAAHNETALITLPGRRGHLVVSVFLKGVAGDTAARDRIVARIGRAAYDWASTTPDRPVRRPNGTGRPRR